MRWQARRPALEGVREDAEEGLKLRRRNGKTGDLVEPGAAERHYPGSSAIREPAEVADARKTSRQEMLHEAA